MLPINQAVVRSKMESLRQKLQSEFDRIKPDEGYVADNGDGIIYVGGGKYWAGIETGIRLLRQLGCTLHIEVWHRAREKVYPERVEGMGVTFCTIYEYDNVPNGGWIAKLIALRFTKLSRVLFLDADAYCINDPLKLFDLLDTCGFRYWRDLPNQANTVKWKNVYPEGENNCPSPIQGGQLIIDRIKVWKLIHVAYYICSHSSYYFNYMFGDQDSWRVAASGIGQDSVACLGKASWQVSAFVCSYDNIDYIVHRCQSKLFVPEDIPSNKVKYSNPHYFLPKEVEVFNIFSQVLNGMEASPSSRFGSIYNKGLWGGMYSSGSGSTLREVQPYIQMVNGLIRLNKYQSVVDVGCGDGIVGSEIKCENYLGIDCIDVRKNRKNNFLPLDIYKDSAIIPVGDILLCKDVLHHWPNEWVINWLARLIESKKWKMIVLCQDNQQKSEEQDCYLGGYRALDRTMHPLNLFPLKEIKRYTHKSILAIEL